MRIPDFIRAYLKGLHSSLKRFPIPIALSTSAAILLIVLWHSGQGTTTETKEIIGRAAMVLALGIPLSLCTRLIVERKRDIQSLYFTGIYLLEALALILYYFFWLTDLNMVSVTRYIGLSLSFYLAFVTIPYFYKRDRFEIYAIKLLSHFFITVIFSLVLYLGVSAILFALDSLLGVKADKIYLDVWILVVGVFSTCFFLSGIPLYDAEFKTDDYSKPLKILLAYIIMPLTAVYTLILYIYFGKIIITLQWPIGIVAHLVLWYSVVCAVIIFFISPLIEENKWFRSFIFYLPKLIIPLIILMFVSIGIRVNAYGITENRYFVIALGLWALGIMVYLNIAKTRRNIIMVISLSLIALLCVVGPWSSYPISKFSQNKRFESILSKYDMLNDNTIVKSAQSISDTDKTEIQQILRYFNQNHSLNDVKSLPAGFTVEQTKDLFGFSYTNYQSYANNRKNFTYTSDNAAKPIDISGYSYLIFVRNYGPPSTYSSNGIDVLYDSQSKEIKINLDGKEIYQCLVNDLAKQLINKYGVKTTNNIDYHEMTFYDENENIKVKYVFQNISGYQDDSNGAAEITNLSFLVLVSQK